MTCNKSRWKAANQSKDWGIRRIPDHVLMVHYVNKTNKFIWRYVNLLHYGCPDVISLLHVLATYCSHLQGHVCQRVRYKECQSQFILIISHVPFCLQQSPRCQIVKPSSYPQLPSSYPSSNCHIVSVTEMSVGGLTRAPEYQYSGDIATSQSPDPQGLSSSDIANSLTNNY